MKNRAAIHGNSSHSAPGQGPGCSHGGFTLVEVMIVVAIIAILAAIGYPSYQDHLRKSRRAEAQQTLMSIASRQQQFLLDTRSYTSTLAALNISPPASVASFYTVTLVVGTGSVPAFTITAAPKAAQAGDKCGTLGLNQTGAKTPANCW